MDSARWERIQEIFHRLTDLPRSEQRLALLAACGDNEELLADVSAMLDEDDGAESLFDHDLPRAVGSLMGSPAAFPASGDFGPYKILKTLGEGGAGIVFLAEREDIGSRVAIKVLRNGLLSREARHRFAREQKTLAQLEHPLIARIYDADTLEDGTPWFAMEYVEGSRITDYCREHECSVHQRLRLFRAVCEAVQYAHGKAIIHRDIKPSNILVNNDGAVKLLDFGIAKQLVDTDQPFERTLTEHRPMTLPYASPEQIRGEPLGTQTDVYSLGLVLYELLTGQLPFDLSNQTRADAERIILEREPEPPSMAAARLSPEKGASNPWREAGKTGWADLDILSMTAMHKDTRRRYKSAEALVRDIDHYFKGEPLEARPDSVRYRLGKFARRNRRSLAASAAVAALVVGLVTFFMVRLARARDVAVADTIRTQRIERFTLNLFDGGDKSAGPSDSLRVVTLLDRGVQNARTLNAEPAVQADLYQTLGNIYHKIGKLDQADPLIESSLERRKKLGADSPDLAESLVAMGGLRLDQGHLPEAEALIRQGLAIDRRHFAPGDPAVGKDLSALGRVLEERGAYDAAVKTLEDAVRVQSVGTDATADLADSTNELATAHYYLGHLPLADSLYKKSLALDRQFYGSVHPRLADDYYSLGLVQHDLGNDAEAERYYLQALALKQSWYGLEHPDTALILSAVGQSLVYQGRYDQAAPLLQQALAIQERLFGKIHPQVAMGLNTLGMFELRRGHLDDAQKDFARMADINRVAYGDRHYLVGIALLNLGQVFSERKDYARAEAEYREALSRFVEKLPPGHPTTAIARIQLGHTLLEERRYAEAESHLIAGYDVLVKQPGAQAARIEKARIDLAAVYDALHQSDRAKKIRAALSSAKANPKTESTAR